MEEATAEKKSIFAAEPVGRLIIRFAIPCVISLVVNALYNIVDQIFIGWGGRLFGKRCDKHRISDYDHCVGFGCVDRRWRSGLFKPEVGRR